MSIHSLNTLTSDYKKAPNNKAYILQAPAPGDTQPRKECKGIGRDCKTTTSAYLTTYEWDTFFPSYGAEEFSSVDPHSNPEFITYLVGIGFGQ
ncbi:MAG: hypothetical protein JNK66_07640 [Chitinophagales bacterium]|nr:hypothetical protein [Chitinophagales bacterium]